MRKIPALILAAALLGTSVSTSPVLEVQAKTTQSTKKVTVKSLTKTQKLTPTVSYGVYLSQYKKKNTVKTIKINSEKDLKKAINTILTNLPTKVVLKSSRYTTNEMDDFIYDNMKLVDADKKPTRTGLINYYTSRNGNTLTFEDHANSLYNALTVKAATDKYAADVAKILKGKNETETINNVYDFMYKNFKYEASSSMQMRVGNIGNGRMACNGFSYLADTLFKKAGVKSQLREGNSHYWNVLTLKNGTQVTFDPTSDVVLNEYKATLGQSSLNHIMITKRIGFYDASYIFYKYTEVNENVQFMK